MNDLVSFDYINHRLEQARRFVRPIRVWFGTTAWHPTPQWLLEAFDLDKKATRDFAMSGISNWHVAILLPKEGA